MKIGQKLSDGVAYSHGNIEIFVIFLLNDDHSHQPCFGFVTIGEIAKKKKYLGVHGFVCRVAFPQFYENWTLKGESLRDAFSHAQTTMRKRDPDPNIWAGFVLIE